MEIKTHEDQVAKLRHGLHRAVNVVVIYNKAS